MTFLGRKKISVPPNKRNAMSFLAQWWRGSDPATVSPTDVTTPPVMTAMTPMTTVDSTVEVTAAAGVSSAVAAEVEVEDGAEDPTEPLLASGSSCRIVLKESGDLDSLPELPFTYVPEKAWLLFCRHSAWPYASLVTDLDVQWLQYLYERSWDEGIYYHDLSLADLVASCERLDADQDLVVWTRWMSTRHLYSGIFGTRLLEVCSQLTYDQEETKLAMTQLLERCQVHWDAWYDENNCCLEGSGLDPEA